MKEDLKNKAAEKLEEAATAIRNCELDKKYQETIEPVEKLIHEHPIPSVLVGVGAGILIGAFITRCQERGYL